MPSLHIPQPVLFASKLFHVLWMNHSEICLAKNIDPKVVLSEAGKVNAEAQHDTEHQRMSKNDKLYGLHPSKEL